MKKSLFTLLLALAAISGDFVKQPQAADEKPAAKTLPPAGIKNLDAAAAGKLLKETKSVVVLDIRTPVEFNAGHIAGAKNVDFRDGSFETLIEKLDKSKTYLVHCASGGRSTKSLELFKKLKFSAIYHLDGGINAWQKAGLPVEKKPTRPATLGKE